VAHRRKVPGGGWHGGGGPGGGGIGAGRVEAVWRVGFTPAAGRLEDAEGGGD